MSQSSKPVPIALPLPLMEKIEYAASRLGLSKQEVMRMAMALGLEHFARINYDISGAILDATSKQEAPTVKTGPTATPAGFKSNIMPLPPQHIAAEDEGSQAADQTPPKKVSYTSGKRRP